MNGKAEQISRYEIINQLVKCCIDLKRYSSWTPRESVTHFCNITSEGCNKFKEECDLIGKNGSIEESSEESRPHLPHGCWQANGSGWCSEYKSPWGGSLDTEIECRFPNLDLCRIHGAPCPCYGCITPQDLSNTDVPQELISKLGYSGELSWSDLLSRTSSSGQNEYIQEQAKQHLCPYNQQEFDGENTSFAQCYLTRREFRRLQTEYLELYSGLYAFYDIFSEIGSAKLIYCLQDPRGTIQFPFYVYHAHPNANSQRWEHDSEMKYKQSVARVMRQAEAVERGEAADFYKILNEPDSKQLTPFEKELGVLYAPDGEFSAFILGCVLRMIPNVLTELSSVDDAWHHEFQLVIPEYISTLLGRIKSNSPKYDDILPVKSSLGQLFRKLGLIEPGVWLPTDRLILLVKWLITAINYSEVYDPLFGEGWIRVGTEERAELLGEMENLLRQIEEQRSEGVSYSSIECVLRVLLSNGDLDSEEFGSCSRIGYENLFAHMAWRDNSPASRGWIVIPLHAHPFQEGGKVQFRYIAFFLATFKDTDGNGNAFPLEELKTRISAIRLVADSAARDYEYLFLAEVLQNHINELLSTPGPRFAHEIQRWISNSLNPALSKLKELSPDDPATAKLLKLKRQMERVDSVVTATNNKRKLYKDLLERTIWEEIQTIIRDEVQLGRKDNLAFTLLNINDEFYGDRPLIEAILLGLIDNSSKYGRRDDVVSINVEINQTSDLVEIVVSDKGMGFDLEFERGKRRPRTKSDSGRGWSLVQIEQLVRLHDGAITYDNSTDPNTGIVCGATTVIRLKTTR